MHATARFLALAALCLALGAAQARGARHLAAAAAPAAAPGANSSACPPYGFDALEDFNVTDYISAPWYVLAQLPLIYQPVDQLYCTQARYVPLNPEDPLEGLQVINFSRKGGVSGEPVSTGAGPSLVATVPDRSQPSKLSVGFDFPGASQLVGTQFGSGPYWVIAAGEGEQGGYEWAIVSSGPPTAQGADGCVFADVSPRAAPPPGPGPGPPAALACQAADASPASHAPAHAPGVAAGPSNPFSPSHACL
ncbi:hypothetical protein CHLNCDRAFT_49742 [Chlorella variabilis]|uniref:Lipocalin/cytosolic fatty-acid binding domain-containing protein n=1 Tax=Chlorella variabilis TaxID=554065 RepID=E1Z3L1_CHLVA|nr:hypothetical protein CHLNCDRAFT_49742 [Chlorella variabilis]EFN60182.1 hypothetical protein CHLNCDRAFT_49742 [Chlorella variabilis]|eukprot:XP_005852284.1 hypothetical protein CHLNCDRAFT_49742 [Chlorella variabilis]